MFIQVIQGRATNPDGVRGELDRWKAELAPDAEGWLGSTGGITDDGRFIAVVRFQSEELARRNSDRPEQGAWWNETSKHLAEAVFHDSARVHTYKDGGSDQAGFVQVIQGHTVAEHADRPGDFTQTVYFTSEEEARRFERERPAESEPELLGLMSDLQYFDLRVPWLDGPR
jgi:hypothetical protein